VVRASPYWKNSWKSWEITEIRSNNTLKAQ
jgi:hypothetical protein